MSVKTELEPFVNQLKSELFLPLIDEMIKQNLPPPSSALEPHHVKAKKSQEELMNLLSSQASLDKIAAGFDAIVAELSTHLSASEIAKISEEWTKGVETWIERMSPESTIKKEIPDSPQEMLGISEETLIHFYQAGNRYFEHQDFQKASDVYYIVVWLDPYRSNAWAALGLSEARQHHYDPALISFSMASQINPESVELYLYSAECCLKNHKKEEAKVCLEHAKEAVKKDIGKEKVQREIQKLEQSLR